MLGSRAELVETLARVARKDRDAFEVLYRATSAKLYGVIVAILGRKGVSDEVLQDVFVRVWERAPEFDPARASPITWMATIARNRAIDELRRAKVLPTATLPPDLETASETEDPLEGRERSDELRALIRCLEALDAEKRDVVLLAYYRGLSREALSQHFGRPVATIKTWLHRSLSHLRICLTQ